MSREVRRVPVGWQHPYFQANTPFGRSRPASRLHAVTERFVGLMDDYPGTLARWEQDGRDLAARTGHSWDFSVRYHITGYDDCSCHPGETGVRHPVWIEDGETEVPLPVTTLDELHAHLTGQHWREKPDPNDYMPVFAGAPENLGWCLYETVSEGTPTTPVFATAEGLVDHLATVGQDWDQVPMRREAAQTLVSQGHSLGSMVVSGGTLYRSDVDADKIVAALGRDS